MRILWFTWKDGRHPRAGGAETVNEELAVRLVRAGHEVTFVTAGFRGAAAEERRDGFGVLRVGGPWSVYWRAWSLYRRSLAGTVDLVIDEVNTVPFFCRFYVREKNILVVYQLARKIWLYEMFFPLNVIGYVLEPLYLRMLSDRRVVTISESTRRDLIRRGFRPDAISIIPLGTRLQPAERLDEKPSPTTMLALGTIRAMKRTDHILRAFESAKHEIPDLELLVAGPAEGSYGRRVLAAIARSPYKDSIRYFGRVDSRTKVELLTQAHLVCVTSLKEGWGLVVTEAALRGTPAVVYDVDGLRDSVKHGETGVLVPDGDPAALVAAIVRLHKDPAEYSRMRAAAWAWAKTFDFNSSARAFATAIHRS